MNKIILIGRLTKEPELRYTPNGAAVGNFTLAVNRGFKREGEPEADFINIVVWNKSAENCGKYLDKGKQCAVEGRLQIRTYDDKEGQKRWITEVVADRVEFIGSRKQEEGSDESNRMRQEESYGTEVLFDDNDVPF